MNKAKKLSIVISHYNTVSTLTTLLDSIPVKDEIEIIVVDDRSDRQAEAYKEIIDNRHYSHVCFCKNETEKKGDGVCKNIGLKKATGDWLLFADSDDFFVENFYSIVHEYLDSDFDVVFFTPTSIFSETGVLADRHIHYKKKIADYLAGKDLEAELRLRYEFYVPWSKLIKRNLVVRNNITFDELPVANDAMFSTKVSYFMSSFKASEEIIYCVTRNKGSLSTKINEAAFDARLGVHIRYCHYLQRRLSKKDLSILNLTGRSYLLNAVKYKLGFKKIIEIYLRLRGNNIKVFDLYIFNPYFFIKQIIYHYLKFKNIRKYLVKK
ncbi:MAG: glycosyltransferase [Spirochaetales bacterium]|nr:glycosyltransferase [Spirochaetales bacterium]